MFGIVVILIIFVQHKQLVVALQMDKLMDMVNKLDNNVFNHVKILDISKKILIRVMYAFNHATLVKYGLYITQDLEMKKKTCAHNQKSVIYLVLQVMKIQIRIKNNNVQKNVQIMIAIQNMFIIMKVMKKAICVQNLSFAKYQDMKV